MRKTKKPAPSSKDDEGAAAPSGRSARLKRKYIDAVTPSPLMRLPEALRFTGLGNSQFWECVRSGELPAPIKLREGGKAIGFLRSELEDWLQRRVRARDDAKRAATEARAQS